MNFYQYFSFLGLNSSILLPTSCKLFKYSMKASEFLKCFIPTSCASWLEMDTWIHSDRWDKIKSYQYLVGCFLDWLTTSVFLDSEPPTISICLDIQNLRWVCIVFLCIFSRSFIKVNHYIHFVAFGCLINSSSHTIPDPVPYRYEMNLSRLHSFALPYHHLYWVQSCWPFQWRHYVPRFWTFVEISLLFCFFPKHSL